MERSSNKKQSYLTVSQFALIIFGSIVGVGVLSLPNGVVKDAHQDGWISTLIGGIYPLYVVIIASYISKKFPNDNILILSKKYFGKILGSVFNLIFATYFIFITSMIACYYSNLMRSYMMGFLTPFKLIAILFICIIYAASRGLKVIGRISEISFYCTIVLLLSPIIALRFPNMTNILPVFGSGFSSIAKGAMKSNYCLWRSGNNPTYLSFSEREKEDANIFSYKCNYSYCYLCLVCFYNHILFRARYCEQKFLVIFGGNRNYNRIDNQ